ncbi:hypothetical protein [Amycolatopsis sp. cmx-4-68]|uniref:hypothetical protein n=1 Tax=Amycolatopsis sp. cmx-4-68 TaxID=2790938 RepID=UPI003978688F
MHARDRELLDQIILTAEQCRRVADVLVTTPPDCAMYTHRLWQLSHDLESLAVAIFQHLSTMDPTAIERAIGDAFTDLAGPPEMPETTDAGLLESIRSASECLDEHATLVLRKDPPSHVVTVELATAFPTVAMMSLVTAVRANPTAPWPGGDAA